MIDIFSGIGPMRAALEFHLDRQNLLLGNLANAATPGYVGRDLVRSRPSFAGMLDVELARTSPAHTSGGGGAHSLPDGSSARLAFDSPSLAGPDGNTVQVDREASRISANTIRYETVTRITSTMLAGLRYAAGDGR